MTFISPQVQKIIDNPVKDRNDLVNLLHDLTKPLAEHMSPGGARVRTFISGTHFDQVSAELEGYSRPLWGIVPLLASGDKFLYSEQWLNGLVNGTDPGHPEYWGPCRDYDQRCVEMCAFGYALAMAPQIFWHPLTDKQKENVNNWLLGINSVELNRTNWRFFKVVVNLGLRLVGGRYSWEETQKELDFMETFFGEDGWAFDGPRDEAKSADYYAHSYAICFYTLWYAKFAEEFDPDRAKIYRERSQKVVLDIVHLFSPSGASIPFGRSMTYRFAMASFWAILAYTGLELPKPLTLGVIKGILLRNIRYFTQKPEVFTSSGTFTIGYCYGNQIMAENYNSPQSTYWAVKPFIVLALPESHPFWTTPEEDYPASLCKPVHVVKAINQVYSHAAGHTFMLTSGQEGHGLRHAAHKYAKFAYSAAFGHSIQAGTESISQLGIDNTLALTKFDDSGDGQEYWRMRHGAENVQIDDKGVIKSEWKPWSDVKVTTYLIPPTDKNSGFHVRAHHIESKHKLKSVEGSFAVHDRQGKEGFFRALEALSTKDGLKESSSGVKLEQSHEALMVSEAGASGIVDLASNRKASIMSAEANTNLVSPRTAIPILEGDITGADQWLISAVFGIPFDSTNGKSTWYKAWNQRPQAPSLA